MSLVKMKGSKLCLKSYDSNGVVNNVFFVQKDLPCPNLLGKLQDLGAVEAVTPDMVEVSISRYFLYIFLVVLLNYFMIKKQLNPKSNGDAKNQGSTTKFKPLAWIQRSEWNRARAVIFSSWIMILQFSFAHDACTLASVLTYQAYLANLEWTEPYVFSSFNAAIRILLFTLGTFGSLCPMYHTMKAQMQYIRALIDLELSPEQTTKDESSVPQELPASAPPSSIPRQTSPYLETAPERHTPAPASLVLPPRSDHAHSRTTSQQLTSETGQQGSQTTAPRLSRSAPVGNAPPSYTDSTTNGANDVSRQAAFDALLRLLNAPAVSRQRQRAFKSRPASSSTGSVSVGQAWGGDAATSSDSPAQSEDWEYVHHEE
ncbi:hypothetical protein F25303_13769 [Fusarium sp. NRRL 25303]|nr:hypothetical protein F25303_13769 [Fusarium sp. NRRL 25303]